MIDPASVALGVFLLLVGFVVFIIGFASGKSSAALDCRRHGSFHHDGKLYKCTATEPAN